jgi:hypothetical protein
MQSMPWDGYFISKLDSNNKSVYLNIEDQKNQLNSGWGQISLGDEGSLRFITTIDNSGGMPSQDGEDAAYQNVAADSNRAGFITSFDASGDREWTTLVTGDDIYSHAQSMVSDKDGNAYIYYGDSSWWMPKHLSKVDSDGEIAWNQENIFDVADDFQGASSKPYGGVVAVDGKSNPIIAADVGIGADASPSLWIADKSSGEIGNSIGTATSVDEKWWTWEINASDVPNGIFDSSLFDFGAVNYDTSPTTDLSSEPVALIRGDSAYTLVEGPTWEEAEANANSLGGHLVTINDENEDRWIATEFSKEKYYYDGDSQNPIETHFWLGGTDKANEGSWKWASGQEWTFDGFNKEHSVMPLPNGGGDYLAGIFNVTSGGGVIHGDGPGTFYWDDHDNNHSFKGIAEIPLSIWNKSENYEPSIIVDARIDLDQRHTDINGIPLISPSGGDFLRLGYALKGNDDTGNIGGDASTPGVNADGLTNVAVLGPNTSSANSYSLEISAESLKAGWNLESTDIVLKYNSDLFDAITAADITLATDLPAKNSISIDDEKGLIRFAAASLSDLSKGSSIFDENILASINVNFDETYFNDTARNPDDNGKFTFNGNPLSFELSANSDETIFSRTFKSDADGKVLANGAFTNRDIQSLGDLNGNTTFDKSDVSLYQAEIKFEEQDDGLTFGTRRVIGANQGFTNLIRKNDIVTAQTSIENIGNSLAKNVTISSGTIDNAKFSSSRFLDADGNELDMGAGNIEVISSTKYWAAEKDILRFNTDLDNPTGVKSVVVSEQINNEWVDIASKSAEDIYGDGDTLPGSVDWAYNSLKESIGRSTIFGENQLRFQSVYEDANGITHVSNSYYERPENGFVNNFHDVNSSDSFVPPELKGGVFDDKFMYDSSTQESIKLEIDMEVTGQAGTVIDTKGLFKVSASGMNQNPDNKAPEVFVSESGSKNLITFQGDLNYDGRVSMKDLAFLNAGAARQIENNGSVNAASVARDVDADFSGKIDLADLSILDNDWGKSLHDGNENFTGSSETLSWTSLKEQGNASWDNSSFVAQNAIEADDNYIGSLEPPVVAGTIGGDNSSTTQDPVIGEESDQGSSGLG